jgi:hypothetical protein
MRIAYGDCSENESCNVGDWAAGVGDFERCIDGKLFANCLK